MREGVRAAAETETRVNVTLLAQVTAEGFYLRRGFEEVGNVSMGAVDGGEFWFAVMRYRGRGEEGGWAWA